MPIIRLLPPGSLSNFARDGGGKAYGLNGDNSSKIPLTHRPVEILSSSVVPYSCVLSGIHETLDFSNIPAGTLGPRSILQIEPLWTYTNSANNKHLRIRIGNTVVYNVTRTTSVREAPLIILANRNSLSSQIQPYDNTYLTASTTAPATYSIDFSIDNPVIISGNRISSSDTLTLEYFRILHYVGD